MLDEVVLLFRELADLSPAECERYFEQHEVPPNLREELESLLRYDATGPNLTRDLGAEAWDVLASGDMAQGRGWLWTLSATAPARPRRHRCSVSGTADGWPDRAVCRRGGSPPGFPVAGFSRSLFTGAPDSRFAPASRHRSSAGCRPEQRRQARPELWRNWDRRLPNNAFVRRQLLAAASND